MAKTPEEMLEEARKLIGRETEPAEGRYPVEYDPIRRYCHTLLAYYDAYVRLVKKRSHGGITRAQFRCEQAPKCPLTFVPLVSHLL